MSYFNHTVIKDIKLDSPQLKDQRTQKTHMNQVQAEWVKDTHKLPTRDCKSHANQAIKLSQENKYQKIYETIN